MNDNNVYFDSFRVQHIPKETKKIIGKNIITNNYRIQAYISIICRYFFIGFIDFTLKGKRLKSKNLFSPNNFEKNDKIILKYLILVWLLKLLDVFEFLLLLLCLVL